MRRVDYLITDIRNLSRNAANPDGTYAIADEEILRYLNEAKTYLQALISNQNSSSKVFSVDKTIAAVANQDGYTIPDRLFLNKELDQVEFSASGAITDYVLLDKLVFFNRDTNGSPYPAGYYTRFGKFYPVPILSSSSGTFRVMYERTLDDLDKRRGVVSVVTGLAADTFTSLTIDSTADETSTPNLSTIDYVCINDKDGNVKMYNIPVGNYNTGTNVLTPAAGFTFQAGETVAANDYITFHKYSTTHCKLADECEQFLVEFAVESLLHKDSSDDVITQSDRLMRMVDQIKRAYASQTSELQRIPQINEGEWW